MPIFIRTQMAQSPKRKQRPSPTTAQTSDQRAVVASRRANARQTRERRRQRLVITIAGAAVGIAVLAIAIGILFDQVITPSQPVAQVNTTALSRRDYWTERRLQLARD